MQRDMNRPSVIILFVVGFIFSLQPAIALPIPGLWVSDLSEKANVIVVGRVLKTAVPSSGDSHIVETVFVEIDQTLKGPVERGRQIEFTMKKENYWPRFVDEGEYGIFFLRSRSNGGYEPVEGAYPDIVASPLHARERPQSDDPLTEVEIELAWVLATPGADLISPAIGVRHRLHLPGDCEVPSIVTPSVKPCTAPPRTAWQAQELFRETADALRTLPYQAVKPQMAFLLKSRQEMTRIWAAGVLLSYDDLSGIQQDDSLPLLIVAPFLMKPNPDDKFSRDWIAQTLSAMQPVTSNVAPLAALLKSPDVSVRRDVAHALERIYSPAIIEPLVGVLGDPDVDVRYYATNGLAFVTKARPQETPEAFRIDGEDTVRFWTNWARARPQ